MVFIGIDNGVTGTIGCVGSTTYYGKMPVKRVRKYTVKESYIRRVDVRKLKELLTLLINGQDYKIVLENPMTSFKGANTAISARAWEATLIALEQLGLEYETVPAVRWQKYLFPQAIGRDHQKALSLQLGNELYPELVGKGKDADGLCIAIYAQRKYQEENK